MDKYKEQNSRSVNDETMAIEEDLEFEGKMQYELDIDRMVNEGLGGGNVTKHNGLIDESTTDDMKQLENN